MATTSRRTTYIGSDGLPTEELIDADLFGTGTLAQRPVAGTASGDLYFVVDGGNTIYRWDVWDGAQWISIQGDPVGATSGTQGDILYRDANKWTVLNAGVNGQYLQTQGGGANPQWANAPGSGYLVHKAGIVLAASFAGNPKKSTVTFAGAFADASYAVTISCVTTNNTSYNPSVETQAAGSFIINMQTNNIARLTQANWVAVKVGEST